VNSEGDRCCGQCHPAVGGCLRGIYWPVPWWRGGGRIDAGRTREDAEGREVGTPAMVFRNGRWERETPKGDGT